MAFWFGKIRNFWQHALYKFSVEMLIGQSYVHWCSRVKMEMVYIADAAISLQ